MRNLFARLHFSSALTILVVVLFAVPCGIGFALFLQNNLFAEREATVAELKAASKNAFSQINQELELVTASAKILSFDSDLQMGDRSILFFERVERRLSVFRAESSQFLGEQKSSLPQKPPSILGGVWFFGAMGTLIATAPRWLEIIYPYPFVPQEMLAQNDVARFSILQAPEWWSSFAARSYLLPAFAANKNPLLLFLSTPVQDLFGEKNGLVVAYFSQAALQQRLSDLLSASLPAQTQFSVALSSAAYAKSIQDVELLQNISGEVLKSTMRFYGVSFEVEQNFRTRMQSKVKKNIFLVALVGLTFVALSAGVFVLAQIFVRPFASLGVVMEAFAAGSYNVARPKVSFAEFRQMVKTLFAMSEELDVLIKQREQVARRDAQLAQRDAELVALNSELKREQLVAELSTLRNQLNPHFLFNSLNSIQSMLDIDVPAAALMLQRLSDLYREILECSKLTTVPISREISMVTAYLELQKRRFGKRLMWRFEFSEENTKLEKIFVPSLLIQTLVENAVKHGLERLREPCLIEIFLQSHESGYECKVCNSARDDALEAQRVGIGKGIGKGTQTGIANTRKRLQLLYGDSGSFSICYEAGKIENEMGRTIAAFTFTGEQKS